MVNFIDEEGYVIPEPPIPEEMHPYDPIDDSWLKRMTDSGVVRPDDLITPTPMAVSSAVETPPQVETILGNGLTNSQKWSWVIGLTFAAWALLYWSQKKSN
jgi:hypothetical protein